MKSSLCLSLLSLSCASSLAWGMEKPNVIFIYADDLGRGMLSFFGQKHLETPHIDKILRQGTQFQHDFGCQYSAPARASMLTGYSDCRQGLWNISKGGSYKTLQNEEEFAAIEKKVNAKRVELPAGDLYLPQVFKQAGYTTGQVGKLEWGFLTTRQQMQEHGWDYYYGYLDHGHAHVFYPHFLFESGKMVRIPANTHPTQGRGFESESEENYQKRWDMTGKVVYSQDLFLEKMIQFIDTHQSEPFFLYHPSQLPHGPVAIPKIDPRVADNEELCSLEKEYASMVLMLDDHVGRLMEELEKRGLSEKTMIVFSVDNGHETYYTNGNHVVKTRDMQRRPFDDWTYTYNSELAGDKFDGNNGMSGKKWTNLNGGVNVPLSFYWPGHIEAKASPQLVANYDLLPTFADMLGVELKNPKDGESLVPILLGNKMRLDHKRYVAVDSGKGPMIVDSDGWKLRLRNKGKESHLYYLPDDYREKKPLDNLTKTEELKKALEKYN